MLALTLVSHAGVSVWRREEKKDVDSSRRKSKRSEAYTGFHYRPRGFKRSDHGERKLVEVRDAVW